MNKKAAVFGLKVKKILLPLSLLLLIALSSCSVSGRMFDVDAAKQKIVIGTSTMRDVENELGKPLIREDDGKADTEKWHYSYVYKQVTGLGVFTHILGIGTHTESERVILDVYFKKGIVTDMKSEKSADSRMHFQ